MAKIIKVGSQNLTPTKIANSFKTSRNSTTNPFKFSNFEGNTLQFADVFEGFEPKQTSKLRMIASSVTGSMSKMRSSIAEPIVNFVNRVRGGISSAWTYAKNTPMSEVPGFKQMNEVLNTPINLNINMPGMARISGAWASMKDGFYSGMEYMQKDITDIGKDVHAQWEALIAKIPSRTRYTANTPVAELEAALRAELAMEVVA